MTAIAIPLAAGASLVEATFVARPNQFVVEAQIGTRQVQAYVADRGRLHNLLQPGARLVLAQRTEISRRLGFQVAAVYDHDDMVSLDTLLPSRLIAAALAARALPQFARYPEIAADAQIGDNRFDFRLRDDMASCILDVKSVTQLYDGLACFPDAPTEPGQRHVELLTRLALHGQRSALVFVVQRTNGRAVIPNEQADPRFAQLVRRALATGVEFYAYRCPISFKGITLGEEIPVFGSLAAVPAYV